MAEVIVATTLAILSGSIAVLICSSMFKTCTRRDPRHGGHTPGMFHVVDPYIGGLVEELYRAENTTKNNTKEATHV